MEGRIHVNFHFRLKNCTFWDVQDLRGRLCLPLVTWHISRPAWEMVHAKWSWQRSAFALGLPAELGQLLGISGLGISRRWSINSGAHLSMLGFGGLAPLTASWGGADKGPLIWLPQSGSRQTWGFSVIVQKTWLQKSHSRSRVPHGWPCISSASDRPPFVSSACFGPLEPWLPWG